ncbi:MAG: pyridoxal 5'-phosphate synthase glutaminase subunit PdxT [Acidobacteriaceae bacterium]|nr:pyridoxal 5'-phosphate synthase glutaminase subunit PdxT [Acidobacteriaceae bacterium]
MTKPQNNSMLKIGVLAIQGNFAAHSHALAEVGALAIEVRKPEELKNLDGLIIPGGESTTILKFLERGDFFTTLQHFVQTMPTFGTCAGCILLAKNVQKPAQRSLGVLDVTVERNAYGRQNDSIILNESTSLPGGPLEMVFIRAPRITQVAPAVEVLARRDGDAALVREGHLMAATFHPEMSADTRVHQMFVDLVRAHKEHVTATSLSS